MDIEEINKIKKDKMDDDEPDKHMDLSKNVF